jgi:hypothetical protein
LQISFAIAGVETVAREQYEDVAWLMSETDNLYQRITAKWPDKTKLSLTVEKIVEMRGWTPALSLIKRNFDRVLAELKVFYVPKNMVPGPTVVFPIRDIDGEYRYAQTKLISGVLYERAIQKNPDAKYYRLGIKPMGPQWLGNTPETLARIVRCGKVVMVEGPFDLLACRLLCPEIPSMSPLTKRLGQEHQAYLRMLGVKELLLMYDNELGEKGQAAMAYQQREIQSMKVKKLFSVSSDPSEALQDHELAEELKNYLQAQFSSVA